jgi:hypothetical protein
MHSISETTEQQYELVGQHHLQRIHPLQRPAVQAVLRRHTQRVRSLSDVASDTDLNSPTYDNINELRKQQSGNVVTNIIASKIFKLDHHPSVRSFVFMSECVCIFTRSSPASRTTTRSPTFLWRDYF